jgi:hypothetical protein
LDEETKAIFDRNGSEKLVPLKVNILLPVPVRGSTFGFVFTKTINVVLRVKGGEIAQ